MVSEIYFESRRYVLDLGDTFWISEIRFLIRLILETKIIDQYYYCYSFLLLNTLYIAGRPGEILK